MKYAVLESGGKQYIARPGETIEVDHMSLDIGKSIEFKDVLLVVDGSTLNVGQPLVKGAVVKGKVVDQIKGRKILVFKYKPRVRYRRKQGHRQRYTRVAIEGIKLPEKKAKPAKEPAAAKAAPKKASDAKKKPAAKKTTRKTTSKKTTTKASKPAAEKSTQARKSTSTRKGSTKTSTKSSSSTKTSSKRSSTRKTTKKEQ
ncbi:MAG: 50S ribosomal protein L21 [Anaerolineales bacterium]|jgi:large subunit ribosomal protein L21